MSGISWLHRAAGLFLFVALYWMAGCGASTKERPSLALHDGMPREARALLTKSAADSCSICAKEFRRKAYQVLENAYPAGTIVLTDSTTAFSRIPDSPNELVLAKFMPVDEEFLGDDNPSGTPVHAPVPQLSFRFHTPSDHLVGVSPLDMTEVGLAKVVHDAPGGATFEGVLQVVAFAYGDGSTFLDNASAHRIEVHCKILDIRRK